ncbi:MAG: hypothetical protein UT33_C0009G0020 [Candidatus Peregrinibacteria bacterium GW2011_GWC2_39_14]|nr:MAG: hypothetical protein US92_C0005G0020 [Candidatus Peregrinibacteria bacterium GW2011_GWA2_38_36]KKR06569.1 MAG: hypothetical protein UT33_C0009G0020 [Candidatus Peregrinibacteria bacterium GW2011_GWC2_39_14]
MNIYLDVDGTLITKEGNPALFLEEFLEYVTTEHNCFWLTTHCNGDTEPVIEHLKGKISGKALGYARKIKPTTWTTLKTDGIDFTEDFRWFDDYIMEAEMAVLKERRIIYKFVHVDLKNDPEQLRKMAQSIIE